MEVKEIIFTDFIELCIKAILAMCRSLRALSLFPVILMEMEILPVQIMDQILACSGKWKGLEAVPDKVELP